METLSNHKSGNPVRSPILLCEREGTKAGEDKWLVDAHVMSGDVIARYFCSALPNYGLLLRGGLVVMIMIMSRKTRSDGRQIIKKRRS